MTARILSEIHMSLLKISVFFFRSVPYWEEKRRGARKNVPYQVTERTHHYDYDLIKKKEKLSTKFCFNV